LLDGERLLHQGNYPKAIARLQTATRLLPGNAQAWNHLGLALHHSGQLDAALQAYEQARRCDANLLAVRYNLGCLLLEQDNPQLAVAELTTYTMLQRDSVDGWLKLATAQLRTHQWDAAERSFQNALRLQPEQVQALNGLGVIQAQHRRPREALNFFNTALQKEPGYGPALLNTAIVYHYYINNHALALEKYQDYLKATPASPSLAAVQDVVHRLQAELAPPPPRRDLTNVLSLPPAISAPAVSNLVTHPRSASNQMTFRAATNPPVTASSTPASNHVKNIATNLLASTEPASKEIKSSIETPRRREPAVESLPPVAAPAKQTSDNPTKASPESTAPTAKPPVTESTSEVAAKQDVVQLPEVATPRVAQDLVENPSGSSQTVTPAGSPTIDQASALLTRKIEEAPPEEPKKEKKHVLDKLNPANWFHGKNHSNDRAKVEPIPAENFDATPAPSATASRSGEKKDSSLPAPAPLRHYAYHSPKKPAPGNRAKASPLLTQGVQAQQDGRLTEAYDAYRQATKFDPSYFEAQYNLGLAAYQLRNVPQSLSAYETALSINPTSINARYNFALALQMGSYYEDAARELEKLLAQNPKETRAHFTAANLYAEQLGQPSLARAHYRQVLELEPQHSQAAAIRYWLAANP
jgi:tetratricopeptide (TPR) repeat protein